jgi:hypothetical protein
MTDSPAVQHWRERIAYFEHKQFHQGRFALIWQAKLELAWKRLKQQQRLDQDDE